MHWDPARYLQFEAPRLRPAVDLLARVPTRSPSRVVDLGCGAGNVTALLRERWPEAAILGIDASASMLEAARAHDDARTVFALADIASWQPASDEAPDVIFSNAALHWLDHHDELLPKLFDFLAPGGTLAVQVPDNFQAPSHRLLHALAGGTRWKDRLASRAREAPVAPPSSYHAWLAPHAATLDLWRTEYLQVLQARPGGAHPVVAWMRSTALTPFLGALDAGEGEAFVADFEREVAPAYPVDGRGRVLFPFRRLFMVATRA